MFNLGLICLFFYNAMTAAKGVFLASYLQRVSPFVVLSIGFSIVTLFFLVIEFRNLKDLVNQIRTDSRVAKILFILNISALIGWSSFYFALKWLEPAVVMSITSAAGPIITSIIQSRQRRQLEPTQVGFSIVIASLLAYLVFESFLGLSAVRSIPAESLILGVLFCLLCGCANVFNAIYGKDMADKKWRATQVIPFRFPLLILVGFFLSWRQVPNVLFNVQSAEAIFIISVFGISIPVLLFQLGVEKTGPFTVALIHATIPIFVLAAQLFDSRLNFSGYSLFGAVAIALVAMISLISKEYKKLLNPRGQLGHED